MKTSKVIVQPGTYFLSDPCYAVPDDLWMPLLESCDFFEGSAFGTVTKDGKEYKVLGFSTAYGDGCYLGSDGFSYGVDAGLIGLTPIELCTDSDFDESLGTIVTFDHPTVCVNEGGNMRFGDTYIDTEGELEEYDSEYEDDDYDEEDDDRN